MTQPDPRWDKNERRNARIRELRDQRDSPMRRRRTFQPLTIVAWFAGVIALLGVLIFVGLIALSPRLFSWIEEHPGSIEQGLVRDFVEWYKPESLADVAAGTDGRRITVEVVAGVNDSEIGQLLFDKGVITSRLAFQNAVLQAGRSGDLQAGVYDLSPSLKPSEIVAALKQEAGQEVTIRLIPKVKLEIAVNEAFVEATVEAIVHAARTEPTGQIGDGKIFVLPLEDCVRIRTGERGGQAIGP